jgi:hypothetical protein
MPVVHKIKAAIGGNNFLSGNMVRLYRPQEIVQRVEG